MAQRPPPQGRVINQISWIAANEPVSAFDYNGNDRIDLADVVRLFANLS